MSEKMANLKEWLGFKNELDLSKARPLGSLLGFLVVLLGFVWVTMCLVGLYQLFSAFFGVGSFGEDRSGAAIRNIGLVIAALLGTPFLIWRSIVAQQAANTAEQSQITERLNNAIFGLGSERVVKKVFEKPKYKIGKDGGWLRINGEPVPAERPDGLPIIEREQYESTEPNIEVRIGALLSLERIS